MFHFIPLSTPFTTASRVSSLTYQVYIFTCIFIYLCKPGTSLVYQVYYACLSTVVCVWPFVALLVLGRQQLQWHVTYSAIHSRTTWLAGSLPRTTVLSPFGVWMCVCVCLHVCVFWGRGVTMGLEHPTSYVRTASFMGVFYGWDNFSLFFRTKTLRV